MTKEYSALNATAQVVRSGKTLLRKIKVKIHRASAPELYLQIWNNAAPTVGTTAPNAVLRIPAYDSMNPMAEYTFIHVGPRGGHEFATALTIACTTTHDGLTAPTAGQEPHVRVDYAEVG